MSDGFKDDTLDSIVFNFTDYVLPASDIELVDVVKANDRYYCLFAEDSRTHWEYRPYILMCYSLNKRKPYQIPLPESGKESVDIFQRGDTLFSQIEYHGSEQKCFFLNQKDDTWTPFTASASFIDMKYDDADWAVRYVEQGEFGDAMWFINKASSKEYAFVGLSGWVERIDTTFYVIEETRVYELTDPSIGFLCDSTTVYSNSRDELLLVSKIFNAGYSFRPENLSPVIKFDNDNNQEYLGASIYAMADTLIVGSFKANGRLHCLLDTDSSTVLARLDGQQLTVLHVFPKNSEKEITSEFNLLPTNMVCHTYAAAGSHEDEELLVLEKREAGEYYLYDIGKSGNSLFRLSYKHGLEPVEQDGFETLLSYILVHWGNLYYDDIVELETSLGAKESSKKQPPARNAYPPQYSFEPNETYFINILIKQIKDKYTMRSEYWVSDSVSSIPAAFFEWESMGTFTHPSFDTRTKFAELETIITRLLGSETIVAPTNRQQGYTEWTMDSLTLRLYIYSKYHLRLVLFRSGSTSDIL